MDGQIIAQPPLSEMKVNVNAVPKHQMDALCRVVIHCATEAFKDPKFAAEYEAWRRERYAKLPQSKKGDRVCQKKQTQSVRHC